MFKIVVVEDESLVRKGLVMTTPWETLDCQVVGEAVNGDEGLRLIKKIKPDLVITDIRMPVMDGIEMIRTLKEEADCEFLVISGYSEFEYAKQAVKLGVKDYLLKPIDDEELQEAIFRITAHIKEKKRIQKINQNFTESDPSKIRLFHEYILDNENNIKEHYVLEAIEYLKSHYQEDISINEVANHLHISESYLSRLFKNAINHTFNEYLTNFRIKKAIELLKDKTVKIYEVSSLVGYSDSRYFSVLFKKYVGVTPTEFRDGLNK
jgi:two-component system response regulator YesN